MYQNDDDDEPTKDTPYLALMDELGSVLCEYIHLGENDCILYWSLITLQCVRNGVPFFYMIFSVLGPLLLSWINSNTSMDR